MWAWYLLSIEAVMITSCHVLWSAEEVTPPLSVQGLRDKSNSGIGGYLFVVFKYFSSLDDNETDMFGC
jgi:hypothetical protein